MARNLYPALAVVTLLGCEGPPSEPLGSGTVPDKAFNANAKAAFEAYQLASFSNDIEVCGYFGLDAEGVFIASDPVRGTTDSCVVGEIPDAMVDIVASYHTHSSFDSDADSEVPSSDDLRSDVDEQVFGYIGTPGGRLWLVDWREATATQLCGTYCLSADDDFVEGDAGSIARTYTLDELIEREGE